jgi:hypothetical protein
MMESPYLLAKIVPLVFNKVLKKIASDSITPPSPIEKQALFFLVQESEYCADILSYQVALESPESIVYYLSLLENSLTYANTNIIKYDRELHILISILLFET